MIKIKKIARLSFFLAIMSLQVLPSSVFADDAESQRALDILTINNLMARYMWAYDTRDVEVYGTLFTEDAVVDSNGTLFAGIEEIRQIVVNLDQALQAAEKSGAPVWPYHILSNSEIISINDEEAYHRAYWTVPVYDAEGKISVGVMGTYEDRLVRQENGEWLIASRKIGALGPPLPQR